MSTLPAELTVLIDGYRQILDQVDSGALDVDSAYAQLGALGATDATGARWVMSPDHDPEAEVFLRSGPDGGPATVTPAHLFGVAQPGAGPAPAARSPFPEPDVWTDEADDLLVPPSPGARSFDEPDDAWGSTAPWKGPNSGFPDDVVIGAPNDTGWDTVSPTPPRRTAPPATPAQDDFVHAGVDATPRRAGLGSRVLNAGAGVGSRVSGVFSSMAPARRRTLIVAVACAVVLIAFVVFRGGDATPKAATFSYNCPKVSATIAGAEGDAATLLGCLDTTDASPGPGIAGTAVEAVAGGTFEYRPARVITRAEAINTAMRLYTFAGGPAADTSTAIDVSTLPADQAASVQAAVNLGVVGADVADLSAPSDRGTLALLMYRALSRANLVSDAAAGTSPSDAPAGDLEPGQAVAALRKAGIIDGATGEAFRYGDPALVSDWVLWAGRSAHEIRHPGSMKTRLKAAADAASTTTAPGRSAAPDATVAAAPPTEPAPTAPPETVPATPGPERVTEVITAVTSRDPAIVASVLGGSPDNAALIEQTALWAGFAQLGLAVAPQAAPAVDGDGAVQVWQVAAAGAEPVLTYTVRWQATEAGWVLGGWPSR